MLVVVVVSMLGVRLLFAWGSAVRLLAFVVAGFVETWVSPICGGLGFSSPLCPVFVAFKLMASPLARVVCTRGWASLSIWEGFVVDSLTLFDGSTCSPLFDVAFRPAASFPIWGRAWLWVFPFVFAFFVASLFAVSPRTWAAPPARSGDEVVVLVSLRLPGGVAGPLLTPVRGAMRE